MNKLLALLATGTLLAGCVYNSKVSTRAEQLERHSFALESVDGAPVNRADPPPLLSFGEDMSVSGQMCNHFSGAGKLREGALTVKKLAMTRMLCADPQRNALDHIISAMLQQGTQVDLTEDQLTLTTADHTLSWKLADPAGQ